MNSVITALGFLVLFVTQSLLWFKQVREDRRERQKEFTDQARAAAKHVDPGPIIAAAGEVVLMLQGQLTHALGRVQDLEQQYHEIRMINLDLRADLDKALSKLATLEAR